MRIEAVLSRSRLALFAGAKWAAFGCDGSVAVPLERLPSLVQENSKPGLSSFMEVKPLLISDGLLISVSEIRAKAPNFIAQRLKPDMAASFTAHQDRVLTQTLWALPSNPEFFRSL
jgi:hypothetical protein